MPASFSFLPWFHISITILPSHSLSSTSLTHKSLSYTIVIFYDLRLVSFSCAQTCLPLVLFWFGFFPFLMVSLFCIPVKPLLIPRPMICRKKAENIWYTPSFSLYLAPLAIEKRNLRASPAQICKPQEKIHPLQTEPLKKLVNEICKQFYSGLDFSRLKKTFTGWWTRNILPKLRVPLQASSQQNLSKIS